MIGALKDRIKSTVPELKLVGEAQDFQSAVESKPKAVPACFVIPMQETPEPNSFSGGMCQRVKSAVGLVFVVKNLADDKGIAARGDLEALRKKVKDQVYGWQANPELDPFERGNSHLLAFVDGYVWWQDIYVTAYFDRSVL